MFLLCLTASRLSADPRRIDVTGDLLFGSQYSSLSTPQIPGSGVGPWDFTTHSRLSLRYGSALFTATGSRMGGGLAFGQPDRHYTLDLSAHGSSLRHGDLNPSLTPATTGYMRIFGTELETSIARVVEVDVLHGLTRRAMAPSGYLPGGYSQQVTGERVHFLPAKPLNLGITAIKIKDDLGSVNLSESPLRPRAKDNLLLGTDVNMAFFRRRGQLSVEYAASITNNDRTAGGSPTEVPSDGGLSGWLAARPFLRRRVTVNDSTVAGNLLAARLSLPLRATYWTIDYRRASRLFCSLATPLEQPNTERLRLGNVATILPNTVTAMVQAEYSRSNVSGTDPFAARTVSLFPTLVLNLKQPGRITAGWREDDRWNDAPPPAGTALDNRMHRIVRSLNVSVSGDSTLARLPVSWTGTFMGSLISDRIRPTSDTSIRSLQMSTRTVSISRVICDSQVGYSRSRNHSSGVRRGEFQLQVKQGYQFIPGKFRLFVSEGLSTGRSSDGNYSSTTLGWGAGGRWAPAINKEIGLDWQSTVFRSLVLEESIQRQRVLDLYLAYGF